MFGKLLAVFILVPLIEFTLLVQVAAETGFLMTFFLVVATGALGSHLARREGLETWRRFHETVQQGRVPSKEIQDGLIIVFAGALLLTPGLLTDAFGFFLLFPLGRGLIRQWLVNRYAGQIQIHTPPMNGFYSYSQQESQQGRHHPSDDANTIDVEVVRKEET